MELPAPNILAIFYMISISIFLLVEFWKEGRRGGWKEYLLKKQYFFMLALRFVDIA